MEDTLTAKDRFLKRCLDLVVASVGLVVLSPLLVIAILVARIDTGASGIFKQRRIGRFGRPFTVCKIRTMRAVAGSHVTTAQDVRITPSGRFFRRWKIDELPQLWNVVKGEMSLVGPRPDVPGYADCLTGADAVVLQLRPGITGPATLKYRDEESLLAGVDDPVRYNDEVIWPDKVAINRTYFETYSIVRDLGLIWKTLSR